MKKWKKRLVVFLCAILVAPTVLQALPCKQLSTVEAASGTSISTSLLQRYDMTTGKGSICDMKIEVGEQIELAYYFTGADKNGVYLNLGFSNKGVTYKSSDSKVASIDKKGKLTGKKPGKSKITIKYKGAKQTFTVRVLKKGGLKLSSYAKYEKICKDILKVNVKKINSKNEYDIVKKIIAVDNLGTNSIKDGTPVGYVGTIWKDMGGYYASEDNSIVVPSMIRAKCATADIQERYFKSRNPIGTNPSKQFKVKSVSTPKKNAKSFTITLKKKVTKSQIAALKAMNTSLNVAKNDGKAKFYIYVYPTKSSKYLNTVATVKEGSNKVTVTIQKTEGSSYLNKFTKGTYKISTDWCKKTLKVK